MAEVNIRIVPKSASEKVSLLRLRCAVRFLKKSLIGAKSDDAIEKICKTPLQVIYQRV